MSEFCYRLQVVLDRSQADERRARATFYDLERALAQERAALEELAARAERTRREFWTNGAALAFSLIDIARQFDALAKALIKRRSYVALASDRTAASRTELAILVRKRVALERHRSRAYQAHEEMQSRLEAAEFDESNAACAIPRIDPLRLLLAGHLDEDGSPAIARAQGASESLPRPMSASPMP